MSNTGTSHAVLKNPGLFESSIQNLIRLTKNGLLVWRESRHNSKRFEAFPSGEIRTREDFELRIGRRLAGATVGYPAGADKKDKYLWFRLTDGTSERYYVEYHDAPTSELKSLVKQLYTLAKSECGNGSVTSMQLYG